MKNSSRLKLSTGIISQNQFHMNEINCCGEREMAVIKESAITASWAPQQEDSWEKQRSAVLEPWGGSGCLILHMRVQLNIKLCNSEISSYPKTVLYFENICSFVFRAQISVGLTSGDG